MGGLATEVFLATKALKHKIARNIFFAADLPASKLALQAGPQSPSGQPDRPRQRAALPTFFALRVEKIAASSFHKSCLDGLLRYIKQVLFCRR